MVALEVTAAAAAGGAAVAHGARAVSMAQTTLKHVQSTSLRREMAAASGRVQQRVAAGDRFRSGREVWLLCVLWHLSLCSGAGAAVCAAVRCSVVVPCCPRHPLTLSTTAARHNTSTAHRRAGPGAALLPPAPVTSTLPLLTSLRLPVSSCLQHDRAHADQPVQPVRQRRHHRLPPPAVPAPLRPAARPLARASPPTSPSPPPSSPLSPRPSPPSSPSCPCCPPP